MKNDAVFPESLIGDVKSWLEHDGEFCSFSSRGFIAGLLH